MKMNILLAKYRKEHDSAANETTVVTSMKLITGTMYICLDIIRDTTKNCHVVK